MQKKILIVGHGYLGGHLSNRLPRERFRIAATTRNIGKAGLWTASEIETIQFDVLNVETPKIDQKFDIVVYCVGFDPRQGATRHAVYVAGLQNFLSKLAYSPEKFIYVSSTGVYGQSTGDWVDEQSPTLPQREGGKVCLLAEQLLRENSWETDVVILRLAGIYGPERIPNRVKLEQGELSMRGDGYLNLIHVFDAADITRYFIDEPVESPQYRVFNVADGRPAKRRDFYSKLAELLQVTPPGLVDPENGGNSRQDGSKRVSSEKLMQLTGYRLQYPTYAEGLASIIESSSG